MSARAETTIESRPGGAAPADHGPEHRPGSAPSPIVHYRRPAERAFTKAEIPKVTGLLGGLSHRHDRLLQAVGHALGYRVEVLPTPTKRDYQTGREYGNNGMCNPTYFMAGALINYLKRLRDEEGLSTERILDEYLFVTMGSCGPCRFGSYEAEYRTALRNSGFEGFRVLAFAQRPEESDQVDAGVEFNLRMFLLGLTGVFMADLLNEIANQIRPFECVSGQTDRVFEQVLERCCTLIRTRDPKGRKPGWGARLAGRMAHGMDPRHIQLLFDQLFRDGYQTVLRACAETLNDEIEVDFTRAKPVAKITGEFWAQTTEGDGNFSMFSFLESQGAEVLTEPIATWFLYLLEQALAKRRERRGLSPDGRPVRCGRLGRRLRNGWMHYRGQLVLWAVRWVIGREYERIRMALGGTAHAQVDQRELRRLAEPYFSCKCTGGEGHLEVAKTIHYTAEGLAHMVVSLKPFGCLPSTQSDGAQAAVVAHYPEVNFIAIETSGEGDINAYSRVQMALGEARDRCNREFATCLQQTGYSLEEIRAYVAAHRELRRPLQRIPHRREVAGKAANFVLYVGERMAQDTSWVRERPGLEPA